MKIIGVIGLNGSGKDEVVKYLTRRYGIPLLSVGDIVREIAAREGMKPTRENLDKLTRQYFSRFGEGYFLNLIVDIIRRNSWQTAGISGIRSPRDVSILKEAFNGDFILIHVSVSDPHVRYERVRRRGSERDRISYAEFLEQDRVSQELFHIEEAISLADLSISNDSSLEELQQEIDRLVEENHLPVK